MAKWLGHQTCNLEVPGSSPALTTWICFTVAPFSNPRPRFVNSQLVWLPPVGNFNKCYFLFVYLFHWYIVSPISTTVLNTSTR